jgi:hypothetical protein
METKADPYLIDGQENVERIIGELVSADSVQAVKSGELYVLLTDRTRVRDANLGDTVELCRDEHGHWRGRILKRLS